MRRAFTLIEVVGAAARNRIGRRSIAIEPLHPHDLEWKFALDEAVSFYRSQR